MIPSHNGAKKVFIKIDETGKVIHPKYYKHLKKGAHQSHLGRPKMGWFLADQPVQGLSIGFDIL